MVVSEALGHPAHLSDRLKIFATDLDEQSLAIGRRGTYPISAAKSIPEAMRRRYLIEHDNEIEINKELRSCLIFARHNVSEEPPFPSIDLISFRNTLIYFTAPLQERVLDFFSFSLTPGASCFWAAPNHSAVNRDSRFSTPVPHLPAQPGRSSAPPFHPNGALTAGCPAGTGNPGQQPRTGRPGQRTRQPDGGAGAHHRQTLPGSR